MTFTLPRGESLPKRQDWALPYDFEGDTCIQRLLSVRAKTWEPPGCDVLTDYPCLSDPLDLPPWLHPHHLQVRHCWLKKQPTMQELKQEQWQEQKEVARTRTFPARVMVDGLLKTEPQSWKCTMWHESWESAGVGAPVTAAATWGSAGFCHSHTGRVGYGAPPLPFHVPRAKTLHSWAI